MRKIKSSFSYSNLPLYISVALFLVLFSVGSLSFTGFFSMQVVLNLFIDNAFLIIIALGETMVIISGGIDISVASVIALVCMVSAYLLTNLHMNAILVICISLGIGVIFGLINGFLVTYCNFQPFIATLATLFIGRGSCFIISQDTINIKNPLFVSISEYRLHLWGSGSPFISIGVVIALIVFAYYIYISKYTKFGRSVYALGGNEQSARLMGLPVNKTKMLVYLLSGVSASIAGLVFAFYMLSGYGLHALGLEMDAIACAVIGGAVMTGGTGFVIGTLFGVLIDGMIQTIITFQGSLNAWWTKIFVGFLLFLFIAIQRVILMRRESKKVIRSAETITVETTETTEKAG
jgi:ribose/xylose/arabinose/galactoside ABC-type transport system permease subunit